jgi:LuxR family maltose regulon positive regulatory protein
MEQAKRRRSSFCWAWRARREAAARYSDATLCATALDARTEGWIAGLQMAALSLQGRDAERVSSFVAAFAGSNRYVLDYLLQEVLYHEPQDVQAFLLQTSILDHLSGPLCDAVCAVQDTSSSVASGQAMLERLEARNLFLIPLDDQREWYRYHHLFAELLRNRLERQDAAQVADLHRRASCWYDENHMIAAAVPHALAANDLDLAIHLIEANAFDLMDRGELSSIIAWLETLPGERIRSRPRLCVVYAWALMHAGQMDAVEPWLKDAKRAPDSASDVAGIIAAIRAYITSAKGEIAPSIALAHKALKRLPRASADHSTVRAFTAAILSSLYRFQGDFSATAQAITEAISISRENGNDAMAALASCNLAGTRIVQGQLHKAAALFRRTLGLSEKQKRARAQNLPFSGLAATGLASILREWNDLEGAIQFARQGTKQSERWGQAEVILHGHIELAQVLQACGDKQGALDAIRQAKQTAHNLSSWGIISIEAIEARLHLEQGNLTLES